MSDNIDIIVESPIDEVTIISNPNEYIININRVIGEQIQSDWDVTIPSDPAFIKNKPTIPAAQVNSDWNATTGLAQILNKPTIPTQVTNTSELINDGSDGVHPFITAEDIPGMQVNSDWNATSGVAEILNKPTIPAEQVNSDWNATSGKAEILNKPTIPSISGLATITYVDQQDALKVDKVDGYGLSQNDFTNTLKTKLDGIQDGAEVNVNADWNATSGDAQILNKPTIPAAQVNSDWNATSGVAEILNKPTIPAAVTNTSDLINDGADGVNPFITALDIPTTSQASTIVREVKNMTGSTLTKGSVVYISGANGNKILVSKAQASSESLSSRTFGLLQSDILDNGLGNCVVIGDVSGLDTSSFTEGAQLYLSPTTAGTYTTTKPSAPDHLVYIGKITRSHPTQGQIEVQIQNGYELQELHNVAINGVSNNQLLAFESSTSLWKNKSITTAEIADSTNKRYVTDANLTTIGNQSGTNTGDETTATIKSKLGITTLSGSNTGDQDLSGLVPNTRTINTKALSSDVILTTADIADSTNKRYVTDANLTTIGNQSGTNTGDNATNTQYSGLATSKQDTLVSGTNIKTINSTTILGSGNISVQDNLVSGTNIKTINGSSILGSGDLTISGGISGSGTTNYVPKFTGSSAVGNSNIYDDGTNIGIGQTTPTAKLDVNGDALINGLTIGRGAGNDFSNTIVGYGSFPNNLYGQENVIVGYSSGTNMTIANGNVILGKGAGGNLSSGVGNTIIGTGNSLNPNNNAVDFNDTLSISKRNSSNNTYLPHIWCPEKSNTDGTTSIISLSALYYGAMFVEYVIEDTLGNMRAGYIKAVWLTDMSSIQMTEETTLSIGDTSNYIFNIVDEGFGNIALQITSLISDMLYLNISSRLLNRPYTT